jgi:hypothetical protein
MHDLDVGPGLVVEVRGPSVDMRFAVPLNSAASYALSLHDGVRAVLDASIVVRNGEATLRLRDGAVTALPLLEGTHAIVAGHTVRVSAPRPLVRATGDRPISRRRLDVARVERLLATLEKAIEAHRGDQAEAAFCAVRAAFDRAHAHDEFFRTTGFSRAMARLTAAASARRDARSLAWIRTMIRRCRPASEPPPMDEPAAR